jgi:hypothetical protein
MARAQTDFCPQRHILVPQPGGTNILVLEARGMNSLAPKVGEYKNIDPTRTLLPSSWGTNITVPQQGGPKRYGLSNGHKHFGSLVRAQTLPSNKSVLIAPGMGLRGHAYGHLPRGVQCHLRRYVLDMDTDMDLYRYM